MQSLRLALVVRDPELSQRLAQAFREGGLTVADGPPAEDARVRGPDGIGVLVVEAEGADDPSLVRLRRWRAGSPVGALVLSVPPIDEVFEAALAAGADMVLPAGMRPALLALAVRSIHARSEAGAAPDIWRLDTERGRLLAPDGAEVMLSRADLLVMNCLQEAEGASVSREQLAHLLALDLDDPNALHATIYRLRRRIQRASTVPVPLQARSRQGYAFRARLLRL